MLTPSDSEVVRADAAPSRVPPRGYSCFGRPDWLARCRGFSDKPFGNRDGEAEYSVVHGLGSASRSGEVGACVSR